MHVSVFGSFARGEAGPGSDIDLLIVTPPGIEGSEEWVEIVASWLEEATTLSGTPLATLVSRPGARARAFR